MGTKAKEEIRNKELERIIFSRAFASLVEEDGKGEISLSSKKTLKKDTRVHYYWVLY